MNSDRKPLVPASLAAQVLAIVVASQISSVEGQTSPKLPGGDPCAVVALADVQKAFPGAKPGVRNRRLEKEGMTECTWHDGGGRTALMVQEFYGQDSALAEAKGLASGIADPLKPAALRNVRYETLDAIGLGKDAVAIVETRDDKRGIVTDSSILVLHRGQRTMFLWSSILPTRERAAALSTLEALGRVAAKRLE